MARLQNIFKYSPRAALYLYIGYVSAFFLVNGYFFSIGAPIGSSQYLLLRLLSVVAVCAALGIWFWYLQRDTKGNRQELAGMLALTALAPLLHVLFSWMGKADPLLVVSYLVFLAFDENSSRSRTVRCGGLAVLFLLHHEIAVCMLILWWLLYRPSGKVLYALWPGALVALVGACIYAVFFGGLAYRAQFVAHNGPLITHDIMHGWPVILFLCFGWFWGIIIFLYRKDVENRARIFLAAGIVVGVALITLDHTRVASIVGVPLVLFTLQRLRSLGIVRALATPARISLFLAVGLLQVEYSTGVLVASNWPIIFASHPAFFSPLLHLL